MSTLKENTIDLEAILIDVGNLPIITPDVDYEIVQQATPIITVSQNGLITASSTQEAGLVNSGTVSSTKQLSTVSTKSITPTKNQQTAVSSGYYTIGDIIVNPIPSNYIITTDATANSNDILNSKTAYVNGVKVTGSLNVQKFHVVTGTPNVNNYSEGDIILVTEA